MKLGLVSGSGNYLWPGIANPVEETRQTHYGNVELVTGRIASVDVVHISRHGTGHARLSNHVNHRANLQALIDAGVDAVISTTVCGAVDPDLNPSSVVVFDDLYFPSNRLPDGSLCTFHDRLGVAGRGHWIFEGPFAETLRTPLIEAGRSLGVSLSETGCYGHVDGPRFNSKTEISALATAGVTAVSQTAGPESVLAGEAELPFALVGFVTDYANGVATEAQSVEDLIARLAESTDVFAALVQKALPSISELRPSGLVFRFDP